MGPAIITKPKTIAELRKTFVLRAYEPIKG